MKSVAAFLVVALIWFCGLLAFASRVRSETPALPPAPAQGIVALTGAGSNARITEAMGLLENSYGRRLLVSGVNPKATQNPTDGTFADPGVRIAQFTNAFPHSVLGSICDASYAGVLGSVASQVGQLITPAP